MTEPIVQWGFLALTVLAGCIVLALLGHLLLWLLTSPRREPAAEKDTGPIPVRPRIKAVVIVPRDDTEPHSIPRFPRKH